MEHVDVEFKVRPNSLPIAIGFVVLGILLLSIFVTFMKFSTGSGLFVFAVLFSSAFILLGTWLLFTVMVKRRETPRSLSEHGVEIYRGRMVPWANVISVEQKPATYPGGNLCEQTDIRFDDGKTASVSSDWVTNFFEVNQYLVIRSHETSIDVPEVSTSRSFSARDGETPMAAKTTEVISLPLHQPPNGVADIGSIAVEFSMAQYIYVILITPGLIIFGIYVLSILYQPSTKITGGTYFLLLSIPIVFIILGAAFPFIMRHGRKKVARSFSEQGVELWNGTVVDWSEVLVIAGGCQFISSGNGGGSSYRKLDIRFRDGSSVYVSGYWATNFIELESYLARMPQYSP